VKRGIEMFKRTNVKILGIIENMTSFTSDDGVEHFIFGKDGGKNIANKFNIKLLGKIPININLRKGSDEGIPFQVSRKGKGVYSTFENIAKEIINLLN
jgi:ATP-binding protein involved in chromosome partitioning